MGRQFTSTPKVGDKLLSLKRFDEITHAQSESCVKAFGKFQLTESSHPKVYGEVNTTLTVVQGEKETQIAAPENHVFVTTASTYEWNLAGDTDDPYCHLWRDGVTIKVEIVRIPLN